MTKDAAHVTARLAMLASAVRFGAAGHQTRPDAARARRIEEPPPVKL